MLEGPIFLKFLHSSIDPHDSISFMGISFRSLHGDNNQKLPIQTSCLFISLIRGM